MSNMSYCRFQNTLQDLRDCKGALDEGDGEDHDPADLDGTLSEEETSAKKRLISVCIEIADAYGEED